MPAGLLITNNADTVLIDDTYRNLAVVDSGAAPGNAPPSAGVVALASTDYDSASFNWWHFGVPAAGANYGLQVFDAAGNLTFCGALKYARVVDTFTGPGIGAGTVTKTYAAGRTYATITSRLAFNEWEQRGTAPDQEHRVITHRLRSRVNGTQVQATWVSTVTIDWTPGPGTTVPTPTHSPSIIVVDVTGY